MSVPTIISRSGKHHVWRRVWFLCPIDDDNPPPRTYVSQEDDEDDSVPKKKLKLSAKNNAGGYKAALPASNAGSAAANTKNIKKK